MPLTSKAVATVAAAFRAGKPYASPYVRRRLDGGPSGRRDRVAVGPDGWVFLLLWGNLIGARAPDGRAFARSAGWNTPTTFARLDGVLGFPCSGRKNPTGPAGLDPTAWHVRPVGGDWRLAGADAVDVRDAFRRADG